MEDKLYKLEILAKIKKAISVQYCEIDKVVSKMTHKYRQLCVSHDGE